MVSVNKSLGSQVYMYIVFIIQLHMPTNRKINSPID